MSSTLQKLAAMGCLLVTGSLAAACSTLPEPGEYLVYRIAAKAPNASSGCFGAGVPANLVNDSSSVRANGIFMLFAGTEEDTYFLDIGSATLDGTFAGEVDAGNEFRFEGDITDVEFSCSDGTGDQTTTATNIEITMVVDDAYVSGDIVVKSSFSCSGEGCGDDIPTCKISSSFIGNEVEDVELQQDVGAGDESPVPSPSQGQAPDPDLPPVGTGGSCAPTCSHDECVVGGPIDETCNPCALEVCTNNDPSCCMDGFGWTLSCVAIADAVCDMVNFDHCPDVP